MQKNDENEKEKSMNKCQKCKKRGKCELEPELSVNHKVVCHSFEEEIGADKSVKRDEVNHPPHYAGKYECIEVMLEIFGAEAVKNFAFLMPSSISGVPTRSTNHRLRISRRHVGISISTTR